MAICPKCGKEVDYLLYSIPQLQCGKYDGFNHILDTYEQIIDHDIQDEYFCPECEQLLFNNLNKVNKFLKTNK